jgi:hypothetical protein
MATKKEETTTPGTLAQAIVNVMKEVKNIEKNLSVGEGKSSYKGVADKDVKHRVGEAMSQNGLCIIPIEIEPKVTIERWVEETNYGPKTKQSVFTEVRTKYLLLHESGESMEIVGYGHGIDSQDKSAGKATTYAMKYALLYTFMVPTGTIDDTDAKHSEEQPTPVSREKFSLTDDQFTRACQAIDRGEYSIEALKADYNLTESHVKQLNEWENGKA